MIFYNVMVLDNDEFDAITSNYTKSYKEIEEGIISISDGILIATWESEWRSKLRETTPAILVYHKAKELEEPLLGDVVALHMSGVGGVPAEIKKIVSNLLKEGKNKENFNKELFPFVTSQQVNKYQGEILNPLLPLHLSLQAFFGISRDENGYWVYFGRDKCYTNEMKNAGIKKAEDISPEFKKNFPKSEAFLLVKEAEWDFYASIFDKLILKQKCIGMSKTENCPEEKVEYEEENKIINLFEKIKDKIKDEEKIKEYIEAFNKEYGKERSGKIGKFVRRLREICAILANTSEDCYNKDKKYFGYKGKCKDDEIKNVLEEIGTTEAEHCKLENKKMYEKLLKQIESWGIIKAMIVIAGIEELATVLVDNEK